MSDMSRTNLCCTLSRVSMSPSAHGFHAVILYSNFGLTNALNRGVRCDFLVACTRLYKSLCRSVRRSVGPSVGPPLTKMSRISTIRLFQRWRRSVTIWRAPLEVYTALLLPLPKSTRLMTPCIRPCFSSFPFHPSFVSFHSSQE